MTKKKKLTQNQSRQIIANQQKYLQVTPQTQTSVEQTGILITRYGQHADIETDKGEVVRCHIRRNLSGLVTGDHIIWSSVDSTQHQFDGVIQAVKPRTTLLSRPDHYRGIKPVVANIDQVIIVSALLPQLNSQMIDRYLVAAEHSGIQPIILINKIDLLETDKTTFNELILQYQKIGYQVITYSVKNSYGRQQLLDSLQGKSSILVGQSGVGKSSIINTLIPACAIMVNSVSTGSGLGQHTTTATTLYHFDQSTILVDSPGVREFELWHLPDAEILAGFIELHSLADACQFRNCQHASETGCAIKQAVEDQKVWGQRLINYQQIVHSMQRKNKHKSKQHLSSKN